MKSIVRSVRTGATEKSFIAGFGSPGFEEWEEFAYLKRPSRDNGPNLKIREQQNKKHRTNNVHDKLVTVWKIIILFKKHDSVCSTKHIWT